MGGIARGDIQSLQLAGEIGAAGVPEALMPEVSGGGGEQTGGGGAGGDGVEIARGVTPEEHLVGTSILDTETNIIKFDSNGISAGKGTNRKEVLD